MSDEEETGLEALNLTPVDRNGGKEFGSIPASKVVKRAEQLEPGDRVFIATSIREYKLPYEVKDTKVERWESPSGGWRSARIEIETTDFRKGDNPPTRVIEATEGVRRHGGMEAWSFTKNDEPHSLRNLTPAIPEE